MMKPTRINFCGRVEELHNVTSNYHMPPPPPDIAFRIKDNDGEHEIKAHALVLAMASDEFNKMLFGRGNNLEQTSEYIIVRENKAAFVIMVNAIYNTSPIEESLKNKSIHEVFAVLDLVKRYQVPELVLAVKEILAIFPLTDDTVLDVANEAMQCSPVFQELQDDANSLLFLCAKFLKPKFNDAQSVFQYAAQNEDCKDVVYKLQVLMKGIASPTDQTDSTSPLFPRKVLKRTAPSPRKGEQITGKEL